MPGLRLYKKGFYSNIGANQPILGGTINIGCTRGRGSTTRMFNYCHKHSPPPSECINQFVNTKSSNYTPISISTIIP
jgi:hypothetical protein